MTTLHYHELLHYMPQITRDDKQPNRARDFTATEPNSPPKLVDEFPRLPFTCLPEQTNIPKSSDDIRYGIAYFDIGHIIYERFWIICFCSSAQHFDFYLLADLNRKCFIEGRAYKTLVPQSVYRYTLRNLKRFTKDGAFFYYKRKEYILVLKTQPIDAMSLLNPVAKVSPFPANLDKEERIHHDDKQLPLDLSTRRKGQGSSGKTVEQSERARIRQCNRRRIARGRHDKCLSEITEETKKTMVLESYDEAQPLPGKGLWSIGEDFIFISSVFWRLPDLSDCWGFTVARCAILDIKKAVDAIVMIGAALFQRSSLNKTVVFRFAWEVLASTGRRRAAEEGRHMPNMEIVRRKLETSL
ncbi:hypothetical protein NA57DRAFT_54319 [Rhizodiscina lignyota]|uniref:Uncharacterized protein n=1 Tax=Rhizodiscina lignyota TaxID=1504668 RepID=A0A9P4IEA1_9PEZI|nr:hypothetical protein NA57DRAFT_54319 [Rhizodiscina lignyota]